MDKKEKVIELLEKLRSNCPSKVFEEIDQGKRGMGFVLMYLHSHDGEAYANSMAEKAGVSRARMAVLINKMEKRGLLTKTPSTVDGRIDIVKISEFGLKSVEQIKKEAIKSFEKIIDVLGFDEVNKFIDTSIKIKKILES